MVRKVADNTNIAGPAEGKNELESSLFFG